MTDIQDEARRVLAEREGDIEDGKIEGRHWLVEVVAQAKQVLWRQRAWRARRMVKR